MVSLPCVTTSDYVGKQTTVTTTETTTTMRMNFPVGYQELYLVAELRKTTLQIILYCLDSQINYCSWPA
jgi:hypothetical protein